MRTTITFLFLLICISVSAQFRMVGTSGGWTTVNDSTYTASITFQSDLTGKGYLATQIADTFRVFTPTEQEYRVSAVADQTFNTATLTVVERNGTNGPPIGQIMVYNPDGKSSIPQAPFGSTGSTAQMQAAIDTYNARLTGIANAADVTTAQLADTARAVRNYTDDQIKIIDTISQLAHGFSVGDPLWKSGDYVLARDTGLSVTVSGIVIDSVNANTFYVQRNGVFTLTGHGFTVDQQLYVQPDGSYSAADTVNSLVYGFAIDANTIQIGVKPAAVLTLANAFDNTFSGLPPTKSGALDTLSKLQLIKNIDALTNQSSRLKLDQQYQLLETSAIYKIQSSTPITPDTLTSINLGGSLYAVAVPKSEKIVMSEFGIVTGATTTSQRKSNWQIFKKLVNFAVSIGVEKIISPKDSVEFHVEDSAGLSLSDFTDIEIDVNGSVWTFYPIDPRYSENVITLGDGCNFTIKNGKIIAFPPSLETYNANLSVGGDATKIQITDSQIRAAFSPVGKTVYASYDYDQEADTVLVSSYDSGTKTLTLSRSLTVGVSDDAGWVGFLWDISDKDTIQTYEQYWLGYYADGSEGGLTFISYISAGNEDYGSINFENITAQKFYQVIYRAGGQYAINIKESTISGHSIGIASFSDVYALDSYIRLESSIIADNGYESKGQFPGNPQSDGDRYNGSGIYAHPNVVPYYYDSEFHSNTAVAARNYSASGMKPLFGNPIGIISNCRFYDNTDSYHYYKLGTMPLVIEKTYFRNNSLWLEGENQINDNSVLDTTLLAFKDDGIISINNSTIREAYFDFDSGISEVLRLNGCKVWPRSIGTDFYMFSGSFDTMTINNTTFMQTYGGSSLGIFFTVEYGSFLSIKNSEFQSGSSDYLFRRFAAKKGDVTLSNNDIQILFSQSTQTSNFNRNLILDNNDVNFLGGRIAVQDYKFGRLGLYPGVLTATSQSYTSPNNYNDGAMNVSALSLTIDPKYSSFRANGTIKRMVVGIPGNVTWSQMPSRRDAITLTATDGDITINKHNAATADSTSNFLFDLTILEGNSVDLFLDNDTILYAGLNTVSGDSIGVTTTATTYQLTGKIGSYKVNPGSVQITVGAQVLTDDGNGNLSGDGEGVIDYFNDYVYFILNGSPTSGTDINIDYEYFDRIHSIGAWKLAGSYVENPAGSVNDIQSTVNDIYARFTSGSLTPTTDISGQFTITHGLGVTPTHLGIGNKSGVEYSFSYSCGSSSCTVTVYNGDGSSTIVPSTGISVSWLATK